MRLRMRRHMTRARNCGLPSTYRLNRRRGSIIRRNSHSIPSLRTSHGARSIEPEKIEQGSDARAHRGAQFIAMLVDELLLPGHAHGHENQSRLRLRSCRKTASVCAAEKYPS